VGEAPVTSIVRVPDAPADLAPLLEANGRLVRQLRAANERLVTTLQQLNTTQAQLLQSEKLSALGQLVAGVAHELNNPLTSVIGYTQLLREEMIGSVAETPRSPFAIAEDLEHVCREAERAARIVRSLLAFAGRQAVSAQPQQVPALLESVLSLRQYEFRINSIEVSVTAGPGLPAVFCDGSQLQQVMLNLLLNAEQAVRSAPGLRRIDVTVSPVEAAHAIRFEVSDNGHGIPARHITRVFDPFFTTRPVGEGTGLGLSICYGIVRDHGGQIDVDSAPFGRTTFSVLLPALPPRPRERRSVALFSPDAATKAYLSAACRGWGFTPIAIDVLAELDTVRQPDVAVLLDVRGFGGLSDAAARALARWSAPLLLLDDERSCAGGSGAQPDDILHRALASVPAPFRLETLWAGIRAALGDLE
jgi:two-component system NtrC family sensor kinase